MLFVARWRVTADERDLVLERFIHTEGQLPEGLQLIGRWHLVDGSGGFMVLESATMLPVTQLAYEWNDLLFLEIEPVVRDDELAKVIEKIQSLRSHKEES